jgi:hypothetical protein
MTTRGSLTDRASPSGQSEIVHSPPRPGHPSSNLRRAKKKPARQLSGGLIATVASSTFDLSNRNHRRLKILIASLNLFLARASTPGRGPRLSTSEVRPDAEKSLPATFTKARFELTNCNHGRSHFSTRNKNDVSGYGNPAKGQEPAALQMEAGPTGCQRYERPRQQQSQNQPARRHPDNWRRDAESTALHSEMARAMAKVIARQLAARGPDRYKDMPP